MKVLLLSANEPLIVYTVLHVLNVYFFTLFNFCLNHLVVLLCCVWWRHCFMSIVCGLFHVSFYVSLVLSSKRFYFSVELVSCHPAHTGLLFST